MNRRNFLRTAAAAAIAPAAAKLAPFVIEEAAPVEAMFKPYAEYVAYADFEVPDALTVHYNPLFMKHLYDNLDKLKMCQPMELPESGEGFRTFMSVPL